MLDTLPFRPTPFLEALPEDLQRTVLQAGVRRTFADGQFIHSRGDDHAGVSILESGAAQVGIYGPDGTFVLTSFLGRGHSFGEFTVFTDLPRTHDVSALGATTLIEVSAKTFLALCEDNSAYLKALLITTLTRSHFLLELLDAVRRLPIIPRTAKFLLILAPDESGHPTLRFRQSDLASTLGVSRASMNRALSHLAAIGLIELGYGKVRIVDRDKAAEWLNRHAP